jgi:hypothetical protein
LLVCFSHLRWDLVFQRPQHLMTRAARDHQVVYLEEPRYDSVQRPELALRCERSGVSVATPILPQGACDSAGTIRGMVDRLTFGRRDLVAWYYTPMALGFSAHLSPAVTVYDCMDELSAFADPPPGLGELEAQLFARADVVFTGGRSLYEAKRRRHGEVFLFPSSIDAAHFNQARKGRPDPADQAPIPRPRIGYFGVIDERMDRDLVLRAARACPDIQFVMLGPVVKVDPSALPRADNLHWLGGKSYAELPPYLANWDAGWMPFALNESTRFISPTKTPEFLAAGLRLVSTAVVDVVRDYGAHGLVTILQSEDDLVASLRASLEAAPDDWLGRVDTRLAGQSWDRTWSDMSQIIERHSDGVPLLTLNQKGG